MKAPAITPPFWRKVTSAKNHPEQLFTPPEVWAFASSLTQRLPGLPNQEYLVNGKSAIEWIMERYQITTHKESGIKNDPNDWSEEVGNPRYIWDLLLSIINVSMQTVEIVEGLPKLKFEGWSYTISQQTLEVWALACGWPKTSRVYFKYYQHEYANCGDCGGIAEIEIWMRKCTQ